MTHRSEPTELHPPLRLVTDEPEELHPLTTRATPLLPSRGTAGVPADVWEELDRAADWVCDHWDDPTAGRLARPTAAGEAPHGRREVRHALRVLCIALRGAVLDGTPPAAPAVPWSVSLTDLLGRLRGRLLAQAMQHEREGGPQADPAALVRVLAACEALERAARRDTTRVVVDELSGARALELLIEVAHDMRSPLGSILFLVEQLRDGGAGPLTEAQARQLGLVYGAAFGLSALVGDVMELARGGERLAAGEKAPLALQHLAESVEHIVRPIAAEKHLELLIDPAPSGMRLGHAPAIQRVLLNLVTNALKYTPAGQVRLTMTEQPGGRVRFTIVDTGPGIPPRVVEQLFQAFRARAGSGHGAGGDEFAFSSAGLGMAICQKLVRVMGGELSVDSALGRGTRFEFELPLPHAPLA